MNDFSLLPNLGRLSNPSSLTQRLLYRSGLFFFLFLIQALVGVSYRSILGGMGMQVGFWEVLIAPIVWSVALYLPLATIPSNRWFEWLRGLIVLAFSLLYLIEMYLLRCYGTVLIPYMATAFLATTPAEAGAFWQEAFSWADVGYVLIRYILVCVVSLVLGVGVRIIFRRLRWLFPLSLLALAVYAGLTHYPQAIGQLSEDRGYAFSYAEAAPAERLMWSISQSLMESREVNALFDKINVTTHTATRTESTFPSPHTIVLVLGESARSDYMHSYGYPLENTPFLDSLLREGAAVQFDDVVSAKPNTQASVAAMMSVGESREGGRWYDDPMLLPLLRSAGYYTFWLSAQEKLGWAVQNVTAISKLADSALFVFRGIDDVVLPNLMKPTDRDLFEIVHLSGSHVSYSDRYPAEFAKFTAADLPVQYEEDKGNVVAHYINSLYYTDYILSEIERRYADQDAIIIYLSDHGQVLYDAPNNPNIVGHSFSRQGVSIPMFVYATASMRAKLPELMPRLKAIQGRRIMTDVLPHAIMGLLGIESPLYKPELDFWSSKYNEARPRVIYTDDASLEID